MSIPLWSIPTDMNMTGPSQAKSQTELKLKLNDEDHLPLRLTLLLIPTEMAFFPCFGSLFLSAEGKASSRRRAEHNGGRRFFNF